MESEPVQPADERGLKNAAGDLSPPARRPVASSPQAAMELALTEALLRYPNVRLTDAAAATLSFLERLLKSILSQGDREELLHNKAVIVEALERLETEVVLFDPEA
jgi:hypothetical protein